MGSTRPECRIHSKYSLPTLRMDERRDELHGFTFDRVKHIKVYGKTKDALIEQLLGIEFPGEVGGSTADGERLYHSPDGNGLADAVGPESLV